MTGQTRLSELLRRWQELQREGRFVSAEELCADCPELLAELRRQIEGQIATASLRTSDRETPDVKRQGQRGRTGGFTDTTGPLPPARRPFQAGDEPVPGYRLVRRLGQGGFGEVWEAAGPGGFQVAFKFVSLADRAGDIELKALMVIRNIRHPQLLTIFGVWQLEGWLAVGMELADRTLHDRLKEVLKQSLPGIPRRELVRYVLDAAAVIDYLNKPRHFLEGGKPVGIQHGDVKPQNIFLIGEGVKVGDFGLVRLLESAVVPHEGGLTVAYAAPEVFAGRMSRWSDQFALAVTYCFLRGGRMPFAGSDRERPPDLTMLPDEERPAVQRALDRDPRQRWPSCRGFVKALAEASRPPSRLPPPVPAPAVVIAETTAPMKPPAAVPPAPAVPPAQRGLRRLRVIAGPDAEKVFELPPSGTVVIGRDKDSLTKLSDRTVSRTHCRLEVSGNRVLVTNESLSGTLVNDLPVTQHELRHGDVIRLGGESETRLIFEIEEEWGTVRGGRLHDVVASASLAAAPGPLAVSRYQIIARVRHGMTDVYRATDTLLGRQVVVRIPSWLENANPDLLARFFQEARAAAMLNHPNICQIYDVGEQEGRAFVAMPYLEGETLMEIIRREQPLEQRRVVEIVGRLARGLQYAHERGVIHRDLKPANVIVNPQGAPIIIDFGLARRADPDIRLTQTGSVLGTPAYMSPEQVQGAATEIGPASDQWSLGIILYEMLTGQLPFQGRLAEVMVGILTKQPRPPHELRGDLDPTLEAICLRALSAKIADRFPSMAEFALALEDATGAVSLARPTAAPPLPHIDVVLSGAAADRPRPPQRAWRDTINPAGNVAKSGPAWKGGTDAAQEAKQPWSQNARLGLATGLFASVAAAMVLLMLGLDWRILLGFILTGGGLAALLGGLLWWRQRRRRGVKTWERASRLYDYPAPPALSLPSERPMLLEDTATGRTLSSPSLAISPAAAAAPTGFGLGTAESLSEAAPHPVVSLVREATAGDAVWGVAFSPDGWLALLASMDGLIYADEVATGRRVRTFAGHSDGVTSVAVAVGGMHFLSGGLDGTVRLWDILNGSGVRRFEGHSGRVLRVALSADGRRALSGGEDQTVRLWETESGHELRRLEGHTGWVTGVAFAPDGQFVVSCSDDGTVRLWHADNGTASAIYQGHSGPVKSVAFSPSGRHILSGGEDGTVRLWAIASGKEEWRFTGHTDWVRDVAFSRRGDRILSASDDETLRVLRADTAVELARLQGPTASFLSVAFSPDGRWVLSGSDDARARLWELPQ